MECLRHACRVSLFGLILMLSACATNGSHTTTEPTNRTALPSDYSPAPIQSADIPVDPSVPKKYRSAVIRAQAYGRLLYRDDMAAWVSTDAIVAKGLTQKYKATATGWIAEGQDVKGDNWDVVYTEKRGGKLSAFADVGVHFGSGEPQVQVQEHEPARPLSEREEAMQKLRIKTLKGKWLRCAPRYNYATSFRVEESQEWIVVDLLPARTQADVFPLGGFHEFRYSLSADTPVQHFSQTKGCPISKNKDAQAIKGFTLTHLTSETPTQFHVFMSLSYAKPLFVLTVKNHLIWSVENGKIRLVGNADEK